MCAQELPRLELKFVVPHSRVTFTASGYFGWWGFCSADTLVNNVGLDDLDNSTVRHLPDLFVLAFTFFWI